LHLPSYIAWRYLFAKKTHNAINIITLVSMIGIGVGAMALVVVLSVTNGFEKLILSQFNAFHADIEIIPAEGKTFPVDSIPLKDVLDLPGVIHHGEVLEESGMVSYRGKQHLVRLRGVDTAYPMITGIDTLIIQGIFETEQNNRNLLVLGHGVSLMLNASIHDLLHPVEIFVPSRGRTTGMHPAQAFRSASAFPAGIFAVQADFDMEYIILPIRLMRQLLHYDNEMTSLVLAIDDNTNHNGIQRQLQEIVGEGFVVRNRLQQQDFLYKVMRSEKWAIYFILTFILIIAAFNVVGSLTMLVLEKRGDIEILRSLGASKKLVERIFLLEGILISLGGAIAGIALGGLISWLQMRYGLIRVQAEGLFIIDSYPVQLQGSDLLLVALTVFCIGLLASLVPLKNMWKTTK
jgi:lipoprotein-releasing system permease protein